jgi:hypothetical protein
VQYLTFTQLQDLFYGVTLTMTGLDEKYVRHAYQTNGQPAWEQGQNLAYINITTVDSNYDKQRHTLYSAIDGDNANQEVLYTRVIAVDWTFYGLEGFDLADQVRDGILRESNREVLAKDGVYPIPGIDAPVRLPYEFNSQYWERTDLRVLFNVATVRDETVPYIKQVNVLLEQADTPTQTGIIQETP